MLRSLIVLTLAALLVACTGQGDGTAGDSPATTLSPPVSSPAGSTGGGTASAECTDSFAAIEELEIESVTDLGGLEEVEATIESCESVDEWVAAAEQVIGDDINPNTAALLLRMNCGQPSLSNTLICEELASS